MQNQVTPLDILDKKDIIVYSHIRSDTNKIFYIGIGSKKRSKSRCGRNNLWSKIVSKNNGNYSINILYENLTWNEACKKEKELIKQYGRINNYTGILANLTDGGDGNYGRIVSKEMRDKVGRRVIDTNTKKIFNTLIEAANSINMKGTTLCSKLKKKIINDTSFIYIDDYIKLIKLEQSKPIPYQYLKY